MQRHERSFGGFRLSPTPTRGFVAREARVAREERAKPRAANRFSTAIQQYSLTPTASRKSTKTIKSTRLTIRRRTRRIQPKKSPVVEGRFRLAEPDCVTNGLIHAPPFSTDKYDTTAVVIPLIESVVPAMVGDTGNTAATRTYSAYFH